MYTCEEKKASHSGVGLENMQYIHGAFSGSWNVKLKWKHIGQ